MQSCEQIWTLISASLDGELNKRETQELEEHLAACPSCRALREDFCAIRGGFAQDAPIELPWGLHETVMAAVRTEAEQVKQARRKIFRASMLRRYAALAAMLIFVVTVGYFGMLDKGMGGLGNSTNSAAPGHEAATFDAAAGGGVALMEMMPQMAGGEALESNEAELFAAPEGAVEDSAAAPKAAQRHALNCVLTLERLPEEYAPEEEVGELLLTLEESYALIEQLREEHISYTIVTEDDTADVVLVRVGPLEEED